MVSNSYSIIDNFFSTQFILYLQSLLMMGFHAEKVSSHTFNDFDHFDIMSGLSDVNGVFTKALPYFINGEIVEDQDLREQ